MVLCCFLLEEYSSLKIYVWGEKMAYKFKKFGSYRERADFSKVGNSLELQDLLEIQKKSYWTYKKLVNVIDGKIDKIKNLI